MGKKRKSLTLKKKVEIIRFQDANPKMSKGDVGIKFNVPRTTILGIIKNKIKISRMVNNQKPNKIDNLLQYFITSKKLEGILFIRPSPVDSIQYRRFWYIFCCCHVLLMHVYHHLKEDNNNLRIKMGLFM